jgi:RND family efflux transporter MFP subunit
MPEIRRGMSARLGWTLAGILIAVAVAVGATRLRPQPENAGQPAAAGFKDVAVLRGPFRIAVSANGIVRPIDRIELKSKASGEVIELPIEVGERVDKGALIAKLDQVEERAAFAQAQADLEIARAELELAEKNFERRKQLLSSNVISLEAQDQAELERAVARSKRVQATTSLERARERLDDTVITAPVEGVILQKYVERGQIIASGVSTVGGGTPIADIANMRTVHIETGIDEVDIGKIEVSQRAAVRADAYPEHRYEGVVVRIAPEARLEQNVTLFDVVVQVENIDDKLKSGMNATVEVVIHEHPDALTIPVAALQAAPGERGSPARTDGIWSVLVREGSDYLSREVRTGRTDHRVIEIVEGLTEGEVLGIRTVSRLKEEHDRMDARIRGTRSFGGGGRSKRPAGGRN